MERLEELKREMQRAFEQSPFREQGPLVWGDGLDTSPRVMLIGEAPGAQEVQQGRPFVGKAGKNLDVFLQAVGLDRREIYTSNVVKIRPSRRSAAGNLVNRPPSTGEKEWFTPWLLREMELVTPRLLVTLGNVALQALTQATIGEVHGELIRENRAGIPLFPLYHPASVIYNPALKEIYFRDLEALARIV